MTHWCRGGLRIAMAAPTTTPFMESREGSVGSAGVTLVETQPHHLRIAQPRAMPEALARHVIHRPVAGRTAARSSICGAGWLRGFFGGNCYCCAARHRSAPSSRRCFRPERARMPFGVCVAPGVEPHCLVNCSSACPSGRWGDVLIGHTCQTFPVGRTLHAGRRSASMF